MDELSLKVPSEGSRGKYFRTTQGTEFLLHSQAEFTVRILAILNCEKSGLGLGLQSSIPQRTPLKGFYHTVVLKTVQKFESERK